MNDAHALRQTSVLTWRHRSSTAALLGLVFGVVMPVISALLFPTYYHTMTVEWQERARLLELPFVVCELLVIVWAINCGMRLGAMWRGLPGDTNFAVVVLIVSMAVSAGIMATHPADAALQSLIQIVHLYFALAVFYLVRRDGAQDWGAYIAWLVAGAFVLAVYSAWRLGFPPPASTVPGGAIEWDFSLPGFISVRYLGTWLGAIAAALSVNVLYRMEHDRPQIDHLIFVFVLAFAFWTGTRAAVLGILCAIAFSALTAGRLPEWRSLVVGTLLAGAALALSQIFAFDNPIFHLFVAADVASVDAMSAGRVELWDATIARWLESPFTGWGTGSIFYDINLGWTHTQPHNAFLQFAVCWGVFGLLAACWLIGRAVVSAARYARTDQESWPVLAMVYALLAMSMVDGALYYPRFIIGIAAGLAMLIGVSSRAEAAGIPTPS